MFLWVTAQAASEFLRTKRTMFLALEAAEAKHWALCLPFKTLFVCWGWVVWSLGSAVTSVGMCWELKWNKVPGPAISLLEKFKSLHYYKVFHLHINSSSTAFTSPGLSCQWHSGARIRFYKGPSQHRPFCGSMECWGFALCWAILVQPGVKIQHSSLVFSRPFGTRTDDLL